MNNKQADDATIADDVRQLHRMGYAQELARRMSGFSNLAISMSIICILAGGITSFHLGFGSIGGASIGHYSVGPPVGVVSMQRQEEIYEAEEAVHQRHLPEDVSQHRLTGEGDE